eukprot:282742_1
MSTLIVALPIDRYQKDMTTSCYLFNVRKTTKELKRTAAKLGVPITLFNENDDTPCTYSNITNWMEKVRKTMCKYSSIIYCVYGHGYIYHYGQDDKFNHQCYITEDGVPIYLYSIFAKYDQSKWQKAIQIVWILDMVYSSYTAQTFPQLLTQNMFVNMIPLRDYPKILMNRTFITVQKPIFYDDTYHDDNYEPLHLMTYFLQAMEKLGIKNQICLLDVIKETQKQHSNNCNICPGFEATNYDNLFNFPLIQINSGNESMIENITSTLSSGISLGMSWLASTINKGHESNNINIKYIQEINAYRGHLLVSGYIYYIIDINYGYHKVIREIIRAFLIGNIDNKNKNISPVIIINCCSFGHLSEPIKLNQLTLYDKNKYNKCWMDCRNRLMPASIIYYCLKCKCIICKECIAKNHGDYELFKKYLAERKNIYINHQIFKETNGKGKLELVTYNINKNQKKWVLVRINDNMNLGEYDTNSNNDKKNQNKQIFLVKSLKNSKCRKWICRTCLYEIKAPQANKRKR